MSCMSPLSMDKSIVNERWDLMWTTEVVQIHKPKKDRSKQCLAVTTVTAVHPSTFGNYTSSHTNGKPMITLRNLDLYADEAAFSPRSHHVFIMCFHMLSPELSCLSAPKCFQFSRCIFDGSTPCTAAAPDYLPRMHWVSRHCLDGEVATATWHFCETRFWVFGVKEKCICQATQCDPFDHFHV